MSLFSHTGVSGIRFNDCFFTEPVPALACSMPKCAGLFAVLVSDPNWAPKQFQPLCFGEFGNNTPSRALPFHYQGFQEAAHGRALMLAVLPLPYTTTAQRRELCRELIAAYNPTFQHEGGLRTGDLNANIYTYPLEPEKPRRRIGFLPDVEKAA
jgi:hypothetical protein